MNMKNVVPPSKERDSSLIPCPWEIRPYGRRGVFDYGRYNLKEMVNFWKDASPKQPNKVMALEQLITEGAEPKPMLPLYRPWDWFKTGEGVIYYSRHSDSADTGYFQEGIVVKGAHENEGVVVFRIVRHEKETPIGITLPNLMLKWEFDYLKDNPSFTVIWITDGSSQYSKHWYKPAEFVRALSNPTFVD